MQKLLLEMKCEKSARLTGLLMELTSRYVESRLTVADLEKIGRSIDGSFRDMRKITSKGACVLDFMTPENALVSITFPVLWNYVDTPSKEIVSGLEKNVVVSLGPGTNEREARIILERLIWRVSNFRKAQEALSLFNGLGIVVA